MTDARHTYRFEVQTYAGNSATAELATIHTGRQSIEARTELEARRRILNTVYRKRWHVLAIRLVKED
jgi:hypothetical protein